MKLEDQVCSLELAKRLKELGVKQESYFFWGVANPGLACGLRADQMLPQVGRIDVTHDYSAFTVAELGELLPEMVHSFQENGTWWVSTIKGLGPKSTWHCPTEADARAKMLVYLIEKGMVKP